MSHPNIQRHFLGWHDHFLRSAAQWLLHSAETPFWLDRYACVLPGKRARKRFHELLTIAASERGKILIPPEYISMGMLPEFIAGEGENYLSHREVECLWEQILRESGEIDFRWVSGANDIRTAAVQLTLLWDTLGQAGHTFRSATQVMQAHASDLTFYEDRWAKLEQLESAFAAKVAEHGLSDRSLHRQAALEREFSSQSKKLIIIGGLDLSPIHQRFLLRAQGESHLLLPLPTEHASGVNEVGVLIPEYWTKLHASSGLPDALLQTVFDCESEAALTIDCIQALLGEGRDPQDITISFADELHEPLVRHSLDAYRIPYHSFAGCGGEYRALASWFHAVSQLLESPSAHTAISVLKRNWSRHLLFGCDDHVDVATLEEIVTQKCLSRIFPLGSHTLPRELRQDCFAFEQIDAFLLIFREQMTPDAFIESFASFVTPHSGEHTSAQEVLWQVLNAFDAEFQSQLVIRRPPQEYFSILGALAVQAGSGQEPTESGTGEVELVGWLETLFDDSEYLLVLGCHDQVLPSGEREASWLPGALQELLLLETKERQFVRDYVYALHALHSRSRATFIFPKMNIRGDYYRPSRLFFGGPLTEKLAHVRKCFVQRADSLRLQIYGKTFGSGKAWRFESPTVFEPHLLDAMSVTSFRDYLECPFRFYLKHVLKREAFHAEQEELGALQFGNLFHEVVASFGRSQWRDSTYPQEIEAFLRGELERVRVQMLGSAVKPAVEVQYLQLQERLRQFSLLQSMHRAEGWEIRHVEYPFAARKVYLDVPTGRMYLKGRIDRIDYHPESNAWAALDYKTSKNASSPEKTHQTNEGWQDLQLPLYERAMRAMGFAGDIELGFIALPASVEQSAFYTAEWSQEELHNAHETAQAVAEQVLQGIFWPPAVIDERFDDFAELLEPEQHAELLEYLEQEEELQ
ncbi:MAG: PD-(D/E)XK nuclease family protein [Bdellovibrionota bacterium]